MKATKLKLVILTVLLMIMSHTFVVGIPETYDSWRQDLDCFIERGHNLKLKDTHVDKYLSVNSLEECKKECDLTFINCKSFSYNHDPEDILEANCFLSREDGSSLDPRDFERNFDLKSQFSFFERVKRSFCDTRFVARNSLSRFSGGGIRLSWRDAIGSKSGGCFRLVKTSLRIANRYIMKSLRTRDRMDCEAECSKAKDFTCRAFNYRTSPMKEADQETYTAFSSNIYKENCELSSQDTYGVTLEDPYVFFNDPDFDFYERTGFGRECEGKSVKRTDDNFGVGSSIDNNYHDDCFELYEKERRLDSRVVRDRRRVRDLQACKDECIKARNYDCKSLAFSYSTPSWSGWKGNENCYLSDRETKYFGRYDIINDRDFDLYDRNEDDRFGNCRSRSGTRAVINPYGREGGYDTVSGKKCYRDPCKEDRYGRFFSCETDDSGGWDYCCRPGTTCSDQTGEKFFWCYVGSELTDQWRPCTAPVGGRGGYLNREFLLEGTKEEPHKPDGQISHNMTFEEVKEMPVEFNDMKPVIFPE